jgi:hypothetical protein
METTQQESLSIQRRKAIQRKNAASALPPEPDDAYTCHCGYRFWVITVRGIIVCARCKTRYVFPLHRNESGLLQIAEPRIFNAVRRSLIATSIKEGIRYILKVGKTNK